jgi:hypothetical protein
MTRYPYTLDTPLSPWHGPIRDTYNASRVDVYILLGNTTARLLALQVMRDRGLLPPVHMKLAHYRREYAYWHAKRVYHSSRALDNYAEHWPHVVNARNNAAKAVQEARKVYDAMFFSEEWQAWKREHTPDAEPYDDLPLFAGMED